MPKPFEPIEDATTLYIVVLGNPVYGFEYHGPYASAGEAHFDYELPVEPYWVAPMRYRQGYHVGALKIGT